MKKTVVLGASPNPERFSHRMVASLIKCGYEVVPVGFRQGNIAGTDIIIGRPPITDVDTVTLYLKPERQEEWYNYILSLKPKRIIFNPGTYNPVLYKIAQKNGILPVIDCGLVLLARGMY